MNDAEGTKADLIEEVRTLRARVSELTRGADGRDELEQAINATEQAEREFSEFLTVLIEITNELSMAETVDALCRRAVELARSRLGFERLGIWFRTDEPDLFVGSFGVDEHGNVLDERHKRSRIDPNTPEGRVLVSKEPIVYWGDAPLVNSAGATIGRGEQAFAPIWDGEKVMGHVSMDNRVSKRPITTHQCELLRLFSSRIGYLIARKRVEAEREQLITQLQDALAKIKTLHGLIPICAACKKIRDDDGFWRQVEEYIHDHSEAEFSHSICPECVARLYPELAGKTRRSAGNEDGDGP